jgi:hypothetical protein
MTKTSPTPENNKKIDSSFDASNIFGPIKYLILLKKETRGIKSRIYFYHRFMEPMAGGGRLIDSFF